ncbi:MAG: hypothetical protein ACRC30_08300 [Clostridium sp.]
MKLKINIEPLQKFRGIYTYGEIQKKIEVKYSAYLSLSQISKVFTGKSTSYKSYNLVCDVLNIDVNKVFKYE